MKHFILLLSLLVSIITAASAQVAKPKPMINKKPVVEAIVRSDSMAAEPPPVLSAIQVPPNYLKTHCFIYNPYTNDLGVSVSGDRTNWDVVTLKSGASTDIFLKDSVFLRIFSTKTTFFELKGLPGNYYLVDYDTTLKKWKLKK